MHFETFDATAFLRDHWQKRPCLIRNPWAAWQNPLAPDDLAGLACEDHVESRLIVQARDTLNVEPGPITESRFGTLGKVPWTLLVQAVDHHVAEVAALIDPFRFVPNWRIDDVMVSYASDGGGVGPHFDHYDVFLIQGLGQRRWQIGALCDANTELRPHDDLRLLADFRPTHEWLLNPGDMVYVPPRFAHHGVAVGDDCMTYSIGFRAPSRSELIAHYCDHVLGELSDDDRYVDPELTVQDDSGEIMPEALDRLHAMVTEKLEDKAAFARWFGAYSSTPKYPDIDWAPEERVSVEAVRVMAASGAPLQRNPASRFSFVASQPGSVSFFVDGTRFDCTGDAATLAKSLCRTSALNLGLADVAASEPAALISDLINQGKVAFRDDN